MISFIPMAIPVFYPERSYPELYADVMRYQLFSDSKTFADAVPKVIPDKINTMYKGIDRSAPEAVFEFVHNWFHIPESSHEYNTEVKPIREHINDLWSHLTRQKDRANSYSSLIPLPYSYVVPGGRFREIYYWDSYFTMLGLKVSGQTEIIHDMIRNFAWLIDNFGHIPNGNRSYFLSRSQPPFFSLMIELLASIKGDQILVEYLPQLLKEYSFWMESGDANHKDHRRLIREGDHQYLNRYYDDDHSPRAESYSEDVLLQDNAGENQNELFLNLRAACESGWDFSSRWFGEKNKLSSVRTTDIIPVDLNSLLYLLEKTIAKALHLQGDQSSSDNFNHLADQRAELIRQRLWDDDEWIFNDFNFRENKFGLPSLAMMYPLFAGIATQDQAEQCIYYLSQQFLKPGGWVTTNEYTGQQWDAPNGWAPLQWITFIGLKNYDALELAEEAAERWLTLNEQVYQRTGRLMEKYNVEDLSLEAGGGEYSVQDGFGWTNGVFLALSHEIAKE